MVDRFNRFLDRLSEFLAVRRGLIPLIGIALVILNAILQFSSASSWLAETDLLLHLGVVVAVVGIMLAWAL